jgi:hypothetical protein
MRLELPQLNTKVDVFVGPNPDADPPFYYWNFTVDPLAQFLQVVVIGAGGGGGSGRQGATGTIRGGGQGGAGGAYNTGFYPAYMLDPTANFNVLAGAGGAGGAPQTNPDTSGIGGTDGGNSMFHNFVRAEGGIRGQGGFNVTSPNAYRIGTYNTPWPGGGGGVCSTDPTWRNGHYGLGGGGGGAGGWYDATEVTYDGGISGSCEGLQTRVGYARTGADGENQPVNWPLPSCGGGGGHLGENGGLGGAYGGGGGGGGASINGAPSGAGGAGASGIVIITSYF